MENETVVKVPGFSRFATALARLVRHAPKGKNTLAMSLVKAASFDGITPSVYGPLLRSRWHDLTFRFCVSGFYGRYLSDFLKRRTQPFSFIDIGSNIGLYTLIAAQNPNCRNCYAFEPNPIIFRSLVDNVKLNGRSNVQTINAAVSATAGVLRFSASETHSGTGSLAVKDDAAAITVTSVNQSTFNTMAEFDQNSKIVKIDVEGHEPTVIAELMKSKIWPQIGYIFFECEEAAYNVAAVVSTLEKNGMRQIFKNGSGHHYDLMFERR